jgi:iron(III) transport system permease protein
MVRSAAGDASRRLRPALFGLSAALLIVIVGLPVTAIVLFALFPRINELSFADPFSALLPNLSDPRLVGATLNSLGLSAAVTAVSALIAVPLAYMRSRFPLRLGRLWDAAFLVPFLIPPYIGSLAWMQLLQRNGFIEQSLGFNLSGFLFSFPGIVTVMALHLFPLVYFTTSNAFSIIGGRYGDVARVFGGRPVQIFFRIYLPMALPALLSSCLIVFILTIEEFGTPEILGSRFGFEVIVTAIHEKFSDWPIDLQGASVLSLILILIAYVAFHAHQRLADRFQTAVEGQTMGGHGASLSFGRFATMLLLFGGVFLIGVVMPVATILISAFMDTLSGGVTSENLSFRNLIGLFDPDSRAWRAILTSLTLAVVAALSTVAIAMVVAFTVIRLRSAATVFLDFLSILPNSVPGMAVAVGLILTWNQVIWPVTPYNTPVILLFAYLCLMLPYPIRMITAALRQLPQSLDDAAYISGANELTVIVRILAPLLGPIAFAAGLIVFAISTRELVSSIMLAPPGIETVATFVFHQFDQGSVNVGMAMSALAIVVSGSIIAVGQRLQGDTKARA